jgi:K319L-like, PKD domain
MMCIDPSKVDRKGSVSMKNCLLGLFIGLLSIAMTGNAFAKPSFGDNCGSCHGVPVVTRFDLPASHNSLTVPVTGFTATDADPQKSSLAGVSGYLITTSSTAPDAGASGWQSSPPSAYTFASDGLQTLYAWAKDSLGIVSAAVSDAVNISIITNAPPVADAGPDQTVAEGVSVSLDASNSDDSDDGIASYFWEQVGGPVDVVISDPAAVNPTFDTPNVGPGGAALTFRLTVSDVSKATDTDTTIVNVSWVNIQPVADAGNDQAAAEGMPITLDGSASDGVDDGIATYSWSQVDINGVIAVLSDPNVPNPQFTIIDVGPNGESLTFELTVTDDGGLLATDRVVVNVTNNNQVPVADAGADQTVAAGDEVMLNASGSYDPDNDINPDNAYTWKQTAGAPVTLSAPGAINPAFTAPPVADGSSETLIFELTVTDSGLLQATDTCEILVKGSTPPVVEEPPVVQEPPVVEEPPVEGAPSVALMKTYRRLAKQYREASRVFDKKSKAYKRLYRSYRHKDQSAAQAYLSQSQEYKAQSLDAMWQAKNYLKLYRQIKKQLDADRPEKDRDHNYRGGDTDDDDRDHEDDDDDDRE